jgi:hypothetical protein
MVSGFSVVAIERIAERCTAGICDVTGIKMIRYALEDGFVK